jgi:NTP pyrophosphatase (non-canonical NTP hydrolase)
MSYPKINLDEFAQAVEVTRADLKEKGLDNTHMLFGMITEVGELVDVFKKNMAYGKEIDWVNVQEEIGDLMWYILGFCNLNDFKLQDILEATVEKLKIRYPNRFTQEDATNRKLSAERIALEQRMR